MVLEVKIEEVMWGEVSQGAVTPGTVVEGFQIIEEGEFSLGNGVEDSIGWEDFGFEGGKEALCIGVVVTITLGTHTLLPVAGCQILAHFPAGVLAAPIRVKKALR